MIVISQGHYKYTISLSDTMFGPLCHRIITLVQCHYVHILLLSQPIKQTELVDARKTSTVQLYCHNQLNRQKSLMLENQAQFYCNLFSKLHALRKLNFIFKCLQRYWTIYTCIFKICMMKIKTNASYFISNSSIFYLMILGLYIFFFSLYTSWLI